LKEGDEHRTVVNKSVNLSPEDYCDETPCQDASVVNQRCSTFNQNVQLPPVQNQLVVTTKSGRIVNPPARFRDE
jgi:hypothetical protein